METLSAFFQNWFLDKAIGWVVVAMTGAFAVAKQKAPEEVHRWMESLKYGLVVGCLIAGLALLVKGVKAIPVSSDVTTSDNAAKKLEGWLVGGGFTVTRTAVPESEWAFQVGLKNDNKIIVARSNNRPQYVTFAGRMIFSDSDQANIKVMPLSRVRNAIRQVSLELARSGVGFDTNGMAKDGIPLPNGALSVERSIPVQGITEYTMLRAIDEIDSALLLAKFSLSTSLVPFDVLVDPSLGQK